MERIAESELIINPDGSVFHLHIKPGELSDRVILVGDPGRVEGVAAFFDQIDFEGANREFVWKTGVYQDKSFTVLSSGIGTDNIDIVLNELDALVNVDFSTRLPKKEHKSLKIVRIGTSGSLQADLPVDSWLLSEKAIGFDGLLNFYDKRDEVCDVMFEKSFVESTGFLSNLSAPYVVNAEESLLKQLDSNEVIKGVTISAPGFYGPQGRIIRLPLAMSDINERITAFRYEDYRITNYEMECSAIYGLSALLGHQSATVCAIIANRLAGTYSKDYKVVVNRLIEYVLNALAK
ncbi:nucleoside phosphorylase [Natronoflexus pectinivorans]|uniref:Uridine phosphorylase n=1 Tax=Natronoflexus pectinivorans TaxID=682526 RepID=A0A4V2RWK8_9BACT|nr:nucleoside phosphorylase [Natronoflexus pectinivorans]TCO08898.1 uridine phosphorylase [Natronoflexus pectinivorans]